MWGRDWEFRREVEPTPSSNGDELSIRMAATEQLPENL
jgi:hypothetical protein